MFREGVVALTTLRIRICCFISKTSRNSSATVTYSRAFSSQQRSASALKHLNDLLSDHQTKPSSKRKLLDSEQANPNERVPKLEDTTVQIIPKILSYEHENPVTRWRHRARLGVRSREDDDSLDTRTKQSPTNNQDATFLKTDRRRLEPPYHETFQKYRDLYFQSPAKMRSFVQVLTTPTADTPGTTLLLHFDNKRYLIGSLGEGTQRASVQAGARLLKVSECFISGRAEWRNMGGLMGMILTLADSAGSSRAASQEEAKKKAQNEAKKMGVQADSEEMRRLEEEAKLDVGRNSLTFFAPPNTEHTLATARRFVFRKGMPVNVHEFRNGQKYKAIGEDEWAPYWADQNIKVWPMSILPSPSSNAAKHQLRPVSPRKRSIGEVYASEQPDEAAPVVADELTQSERDQLTAKAVVAEMFNSTWRLDTLYPTRLADVKMPAVIFCRNHQTNKIERYHGPRPGGNVPLPDPDLEVLVRKPWPGALVQNLPPTQPAEEALSYIIRNHKQRGKFNPNNALALKVPKGRMWAQLAAGESVVNENGETVTPDQVLGESKEGGGFAVVHLPDPSYIDNLIARPEWREQKVMAGVGAIVWICGAGVATDPRVRTFMQEFDQLEHVVSSPDYCPNNIALESAAASTIRLRQVDPKRYRVPVHGCNQATENHIALPLPKNAQSAVRGQVVQLEPNMEVHRKQVIPPLDVRATETELSKEILDEAASAHEAIKADSSALDAWASTLPDPNVEITTLGTGSALPSKYRNVSATLVQVPGWGNMLFDCGENTLGQLRRVFPPEELDSVLRGLRLIFISHMHADHHLGTVGVIKAWYELVHNAQPAPLPSADADIASLLKDQDRLTVIGEPTMQHWLNEYAAIEDYGFSRLAPLCISPAYPYRSQRSNLSWFVPPSDLAKIAYSQRTARLASSSVDPSQLGLADVQAVLVQHCHGARAVSITWPNGFKASYSGDCRPNKAFVQIGKGSTVCIHEATFDDELQGDAEAKNHSTTSEALGVAQGMGAKACVLTHFSQRYQKLPVLEHGNGDAGEGAAVTQDMPMLNSDAIAYEEEVSANPENALFGPVEDAATYADQPTDAESGQQIELPSKHSNGAATGQGPTAVKFKLQSDMKVCVAFDYMRVRLGDVAEMQHFTPALLKLFADDTERESETAGPAVPEIGEEEVGSKKLRKGKMAKKDKRKSGGV